MAPGSRRQFLAEVGRGMFVAGLGFSLATDLGLSTTMASSDFDGETDRLRFGKLEPLVSLMQETPIAKLLPKLVQALKDGKIDIVIGTHAILNKDVGFKDLGLLIIDEEQKFGVASKEKLRSFKVNIDTLTLTATPIPITLQF